MEADETFEFRVMRDPEGVKAAHTLGNYNIYKVIVRWEYLCHGPLNPMHCRLVDCKLYQRCYYTASP